MADNSTTPEWWQVPDGYWTKWQYRIMNWYNGCWLIPFPKWLLKHPHDWKCLK